MSEFTNFSLEGKVALVTGASYGIGFAIASAYAECGATICKDLKGIENGAPLCPCPECVRNAVLALGEVLGE